MFSHSQVALEGLAPGTDHHWIARAGLFKYVFSGEEVLVDLDAYESDDYIESSLSVGILGNLDVIESSDDSDALISVVVSGNKDSQEESDYLDSIVDVEDIDYLGCFLDATDDNDSLRSRTVTSIHKLDSNIELGKRLRSQIMLAGFFSGKIDIKQLLRSNIQPAINLDSEVVNHYRRFSKLTKSRPLNSDVDSSMRRISELEI